MLVMTSYSNLTNLLIDQAVHGHHHTAKSVRNPGFLGPGLWAAVVLGPDREVLFATSSIKVRRGASLSR